MIGTASCRTRSAPRSSRRVATDLKAAFGAAMVVGACLLSPPTFAEHEGDPHYTPAGFFDTHVCNWPDRPHFLMALFSTARFDEIASVAVFAPNGTRLGDLDLNRFRVFKPKSGPLKHVFISKFDLPANALDGWYRAEISLKDGSRVEGRDYVIQHIMDQATGAQPPAGAPDIPVSSEFHWDPVPGARFYEVFVQDLWADRTTDSGLLTEPRFVPPKGLLQSGGEYVWRIHARDSNGNVLLGDFNHGSLSPEMRFTVR